MRNSNTGFNVFMTVLVAIVAFVGFVFVKGAFFPPEAISRKYLGKVLKYDILVDEGFISSTKRLKVVTDSGVYVADEAFSPPYGDSVFLEDRDVVAKFLCFHSGKCLPIYP